MSTNYKRKNSILYIHHNADVYGGGDASLLAMLGELDLNIFKPRVLCTAKSLFTERLERIGIEYRIVDGAYLNRLGYLRLALLLLRLCLFIKLKRIKIIHVNSLGRLQYLTVLTKYLGVKSVYNLRSLFVTRTIHGRRKFAVNRSDKIIAHCEHMKKTAIEQGLDKSKILRIYNGAAQDEFNPAVSGAVVRREFGADNGSPIVGMVGRVVPWKGCDEFIMAAKTVTAEFPDARFVIVGECPDQKYYERLLRMIRNLDMNDHIIFTGLRTDMPQVYAALDMFLLPSWEEPFGRSTLEAMAAGKPIAGTDCGGTHEQIIDNVTGFLVPPCAPDALAETTIRMLRDPEKACRMGAAARERVLAAFSIESQTRQVEQLYRSLLQIEEQVHETSFAYGNKQTGPGVSGQVSGSRRL